jgi:hypothetical protein
MSSPVEYAGDVFPCVSDLSRDTEKLCRLVVAQGSRIGAKSEVIHVLQCCERTYVGRSKDWLCGWNSAANAKPDIWTGHRVAFLVFVVENAVVLTAWNVFFGESC